MRLQPEGEVNHEIPSAAEPRERGEPQESAARRNRNQNRQARKPQRPACAAPAGRRDERGVGAKQSSLCVVRASAVEQPWETSSRKGVPLPWRRSADIPVGPDRAPTPKPACRGGAGRPTRMSALLGFRLRRDAFFCGQRICAACDNLSLWRHKRREKLLIIAAKRIGTGSVRRCAGQPEFFSCVSCVSRFTDSFFRLRLGNCRKAAVQRRFHAALGSFLLPLWDCGDEDDGIVWPAGFMVKTVDEVSLEL